MSERFVTMRVQWSQAHKKHRGRLLFTHLFTNFFLPVRKDRQVFYHELFQPVREDRLVFVLQTLRRTAGHGGKGAAMEEEGDKERGGDKITGQ